MRSCRELWLWCCPQFRKVVIVWASLVTDKVIDYACCFFSHPPIHTFPPSWSHPANANEMLIYLKMFSVLSNWLLLPFDNGNDPPNDAFMIYEVQSQIEYNITASQTSANWDFQRRSTRVGGSSCAGAPELSPRDAAAPVWELCKSSSVLLCPVWGQGTCIISVKGCVLVRCTLVEAV